MAEGYARHLQPDLIEAYSAGVQPHGMNPYAVAVMKEDGIDISAQHSKHVDSLKDISFDYVITVCDHAHETCPVFHGKTRIVHAGFDDPPRLAVHAKTPEEALNHYRSVRDQIKLFIRSLSPIVLKSLPSKNTK